MGIGLEGKVAIVTGSGSTKGIGHIMALGLVRAGARVAMVDTNTEWLAQGVASVRAVGGHACAAGVVADVTDPEAVERAVHQTIDELGGLRHQRRYDTAGGVSDAQLASGSVAAWDQ
jgi:3-oxoacyl-[acyl-carrier protein] reductase